MSRADAAAVCVDLLAAAFMSAPEGGHAACEHFNADPRRGGGLVLLSRIRAYIRTNLSRPALDPASIADAHGISKRYLHALFATTGTSVGAFIREERLTVPYRPRQPRLRDLSVTEISATASMTCRTTRRFKAKYACAHIARTARTGTSRGHNRQKRCQPAKNMRDAERFLGRHDQPAAGLHHRELALREQILDARQIRDCEAHGGDRRGVRTAPGRRSGDAFRRREDQLRYQRKVDLVAVAVVLPAVGGIP